MIEGADLIIGLSSFETNLAAGLKQTEWHGIGWLPVTLTWNFHFKPYVSELEMYSDVWTFSYFLNRKEHVGQKWAHPTWIQIGLSYRLNQGCKDLAPLIKSVDWDTVTIMVQDPAAFQLMQEAEDNFRACLHIKKMQDRWLNELLIVRKSALLVHQGMWCLHSTYEMRRTKREGGVEWRAEVERRSGWADKQKSTHVHHPRTLFGYRRQFRIWKRGSYPSSRHRV